MNKIESKIRSGEYQSVAFAASAGTNPKSHRGIFVISRIEGIDKLAALTFAASAKANVPIETVFQQIKETVANWGIG